MVADAEAMAHRSSRQSRDPHWLLLDRRPARHARRSAPAAHEPRRAAAALERAQGRHEPRRPAAAGRGRGPPDHRLGPWPARPDAGADRAVAGPRPHQHPVRGDGQARLRLRHELVALGRRASSCSAPCRCFCPSEVRTDDRAEAHDARAGSRRHRAGGAAAAAPGARRAGADAAGRGCGLAVRRPANTRRPRRSCSSSPTR